VAVYFIQDVDSGYVKIGHAADPSARFVDLQCATPHCLQFIRIVDGGQKVETWFHRKFAKYRIRGEWFNFAEDMLTIAAPDEIPKRNDEPIMQYRSLGARLRAANALGLLSEQMKRDYAPLLNSNA